MLPSFETSTSSPSSHRLDDEDASFFALGGDSGLAVQLAAACEREGLGLSVQDVFDYPTRKLQAARLVESNNDTAVGEQVELKLIFELKLK